MIKVRQALLTRGVSSVFPILHTRKLRVKTGEWLDIHEQIVAPDFDIKAWAQSFGKPVVYASIKSCDQWRSIAKVCVKSGKALTTV